MDSISKNVFLDKGRGKKFPTFVRFLFFLSLLALIFFGIFFVSRASFLQVTEVNVDGNHLVTETEILNVADGILEEKLIFLFPRRNALLLPKNTIKNSLLDTFPQFQLVNISVLNSTTLSIFVKERTPHYLGCVKSNAEETQDIPTGFFKEILLEDCYFADQNGFLFQRAPHFSDNVYRKFILDNVNVGEYITDEQQDFQNINQTISLLQDNNSILVRRVNIDPLFTKVFLSQIGEYKGTHSSLLLFDHHTPSEKISQTFNLLFTEEKFLARLNNPESLDYIDLRIPDRIIYKFVGDDEDVGDRQTKDTQSQQDLVDNNTPDQQNMSENESENNPSNQQDGEEESDTP